MQNYDPDFGYLVEGPFYVYEIYIGRTWGGDPDEFATFLLVTTKEQISVKDFPKMVAEGSRRYYAQRYPEGHNRHGAGYGERFLKDVARRLCTPEDGGKKKVPHYRTVEWEGYRVILSLATHPAIIFDNAKTMKSSH